jgi:hypothetical protein
MTNSDSDTTSEGPRSEPGETPSPPDATSDESTDVVGPSSESSDDETHVAERHRAFVRMLDRSLSRVYAGGSVALLSAVGGILGGAWWLGQLWGPIPWLATITSVLLILVVLRSIVRRRAEHLLERLEAYCRTNDLSIETLRDYYRRRDLYPYFEALFDVLERHGDDAPTSTTSSSNDGGQD